MHESTSPSSPLQSSLSAPLPETSVTPPDAAPVPLSSSAGSPAEPFTPAAAEKPTEATPPLKDGPAKLAGQSGPASDARGARPRWKKFVRRRGRPSLLTEEVADAMYESILECGLTDSRAGLLAEISTSTVSRWKQEQPHFADFLETARTEFESAEVHKILNAKTRDGQFNPQNAKWILERTNPERWGRYANRPPASRIPSPPVEPARPCDDMNHELAGCHRPVDSSDAFAASSGAPGSHAEPTRNHCPNDVFAATQQSKSHQNIPEIPTASAAISGANTRSAHACPLGVWGIPSDPGADVIRAYAAELANAHFHQLQQSKSSQNIPEIHHRSNPVVSRPLPSPSALVSHAIEPDHVQSVAEVAALAAKPARHLPRKQRRREAHLARRAASKAARAARRCVIPAEHTNVEHAAPPADLIAA